MTVLMSNKWHSAVIGFGCVSSRILQVKFKFSMVKVCMVVVYDLTQGERLLNDLDRVVNRKGNGYRLCVLGGLNGCRLCILGDVYG